MYVSAEPLVWVIARDVATKKIIDLASCEGEAVAKRWAAKFRKLFPAALVVFGSTGLPYTCDPEIGA